MVNLITPEILSKIAPSIKGMKAIQICDSINTIGPKYGLDTKNELEEFLATILHESGEFSIQAENLNYTTPERLMAIWPRHFKTIQQATNYIKNPKALGNYIYGQTSIAKDLGNISPDDGFNFRGGGPIQLTGRYSYQAFANFMGWKGTLAELADLVRTDIHWGIESACWEFCIDKKLLDEAQADNFRTVTLRINGGLIGWDKRETYYKRCKKFLS